LTAQLKERLTDYAFDAGFTNMGVCRTTDVPQIAERLKTYVDKWPPWQNEMDGRAHELAW